MHGQGEQAMTRMALNGTRDVMSYLGEQSRAMNRSENGAPNLDAVASGDTIREMLRTRLRTSEHEKVQLRTREKRSSMTGGSMGSTPGGSTGMANPSGNVGAGGPNGTGGPGKPGGRK